MTGVFIRIPQRNSTDKTCIQPVAGGCLSPPLTIWSSNITEEALQLCVLNSIGFPLLLVPVLYSVRITHIVVTLS